MKHLIDIESLDVPEINQIILRASEFEKNKRTANHPDAHVLNMFFENSTRTKMSFEMAINKIGAKRYDFCAQNSSLNKGEDIYDTINNLTAIGMSVVVLRHGENSLAKELSLKKYFNDISFINAGSGTSAHPTQALLDFYTMKKHFGDVIGKTIVITGDIAHSRVAKSDIALLKKFGSKVRCLAPDYFIDKKIEGVEYFDNLKDAFEGADIIMALRIQKERIEEKVDIQDYIEKFQITHENLPEGAFLMHPGPVNWGVEIKDDVIDTKYSQTILEQAKNGVYIRMAVLDMLLGQRGL